MHGRLAVLTLAVVLTLGTGVGLAADAAVTLRYR